jgi:hypothetical protein
MTRNLSMRAHELKVWLRGSLEPISAPEIQELLGVEPGAIPRASLRSLEFVLAALRDTYADELEVWLWFVRPRRELRGQCPTDLLLAGHVTELEALVVHDWNRHLIGGDRRGITVDAPTSFAAAH